MFKNSTTDYRRAIDDNDDAILTPLREAEEFLRTVLPEPRPDEVYRLEVFPPPERGDWKNYLSIEALADRLLREGEHANSYFALFTFPRKGNDRKAASALRCAVVWLDLDFGPFHSKPNPYETLQKALDALEAFPLVPAAVLNTGHGVHVFWRLRQPVEGEQVPRLLTVGRALTSHLGGDSGVIDAARVLRLPGTKNLDIRGIKDSKVYPVELVEWHGYSLNSHRVYDLDDFETVLGPEAISAARRDVHLVAEGEAQGEAMTLPGGEALDFEPSSLLAMWLRPEGVSNGDWADRSGTLVELAALVWKERAWTGAAPDELRVAAILAQKDRDWKHFKGPKYVDRPQAEREQIHLGQTREGLRKAEERGWMPPPSERESEGKHPFAGSGDGGAGP